MPLNLDGGAFGCASAAEAQPNDRDRENIPHRESPANELDGSCAADAAARRGSEMVG